MGLFKNASTVLRANIREYGMYIALFVIMAIFTILTDGVFMSSSNDPSIITELKPD